MNGYRETRPRAALTGAVACVWTQQVPEHGQLQRVVPDGCLDLIWRDGALEVVGPDTGPRLVPLAPGGIAGLRLRPGRAELLLGEVPTAELRDLQVDLRQLWGARARAVADRLAETRSAAEAAGLLEGLAAVRLPDHRHDPAIAEAVRALGSPRPPAVPQLAEHLGWSLRHFRRRFTAAVGYGPKTLQSVLRFRRALELGSRRTPTPGLAELAATAGYADQAHLSREVRRLSGLTAAELLTGRKPGA